MYCTVIYRNQQRTILMYMKTFLEFDTNICPYMYFKEIVGDTQNVSSEALGGLVKSHSSAHLRS